MELNPRDRQLLTVLQDIQRRLARLETKEYGDGGGGAVDSVNGQTGVVVLDADDIDDSATTHKFATAAELALVAYLNASAADKYLYSTGAGAWAEGTITAFGRNLLDAADAAAGRTTLGLGTIATEAETAYAKLGGRAGGQTLKGGTAASETLTLMSTDHATKGKILFGTSGYDEVNNRLGVGTASPVNRLHVNDTALAARFERDRAASGVGHITTMVVKTYASVAASDGFGPFINFLMGDDSTSEATIGLFGAERRGADNTGDIIFSAFSGGVEVPVIRASNTGYAGLGAVNTLIVPLASAHVLQSTLGSYVLMLQSTATNDDPTWAVAQNRVATTNNTVTTLHTYTMPASTNVLIEAFVTARRTGGSSGTANDGAAYKLTGYYKNEAGTATIIGTVIQTVVGESQAGWDATLDTSGADVRVRVTGATNNNITWHLHRLNVYPLSS